MFSGMGFFDEILQLLQGNGIIFSSAPMMSCFVIDALRKDSCEDAVRIILVPAISHTMDEAEVQRTSVLELSEGRHSVSIAEDRWRKSGETIGRRLLAQLGVFTGIFARDCETVRLSRLEADRFLEKYHSYGKASYRYCYGLRLRRVRKHICNLPETGPGNCSATGDTACLEPGSLLAVSAFSNARRWDKGGQTVRSYEWVRYASIPEIRISGGMGKTLRRFMDEVNPDDIMSYADLEWSDGDVYRKLGFQKEGKREPVTFAIDTSDWSRTALNRMPAESLASLHDGTGHIRYFRNYGSIKYRLKITEYE